MADLAFNRWLSQQIGRTATGFNANSFLREALRAQEILGGDSAGSVPNFWNVTPLLELSHISPTGVEEQTHASYRRGRCAPWQHLATEGRITQCEN